MPDRSAAADAAAAPAAAGAGAGADRLVRRKLADALGLGRSLYAASPAVLKAGLDNLAWLSAPVVNTVVNKVNPLAQGLVDRLDDGVDTVTAKLVSANTTAQAAGADLKFAASQSLELASKQWHATVDSILVPLHPTLAANVYFTQAVEQFTQLFAAAQAQVQSAAASADAKVAEPALASAAVFVARVKQQLAALWDERLVPLTEAFYAAARARYASGAKSADEAVAALKQALGAAWNAQVLQVFASRVGEPSREVYNKVLSKFVQLWDSKTGTADSIASGPAFVAAMKGALGGLWTDRLRDPVLELYEAIKAQSVKNAQALRDLAARAQRDTDAADAAAAQATADGGAPTGGAVVSLFTALQATAQTQLTTLHALLASAQLRAQTQAEALSHWSLRRLYSTGQGLVTAAYDQTVTRAVQRSLQLSAVTLDFLLPRAEGEELNPSKAQGKGEPIAAAAAADAKSPAPAPAPAPAVAESAAANSALTLRVLRDRASARVRARVQRAVAGAKKAVSRSDALAERTAAQLQPYVGVNVYAESKEFLNRTQQLLTSIQTFAAETKGQADKNSAAVQATVKAAALVRVRTALTAVNAEFAKRTSAVQALLQKLDATTGASARAVTVRDAVTAKSRTAAAAIRARLAVAVTKLQALAASAKDMTDVVLDRELAQLPHDLLRLLRVLPTLLPQQLLAAGAQAQGAAAKAGAKASNGLRALLAALSEAVKAVAAYTAAVAGRVRGLRASSPAAASASASASSSASTSASASAGASSASSSATAEAAAGSPAAAGAGAGATLSPVPSSASLSLTPNNGSPQLSNAVLAPAPAPAPAPTAAGAASPVKVIAAAYDSLASAQAAEAAAAAPAPAVAAAKKQTPAAKRNGSKRNRRAVAAAADEETVKSADDQPAAADE